MQPSTNHYRYRVEDEIGRGGMGLVHRATDAWTNRTVAIKSARSPEDEAELEREIRTLARLPSRFAIELLDVDRFANRRLFFAMELLTSPSLDRLLNEGETRRVLLTLRSLLVALSEIHGAGFVHGDLKPANVFSTGEAEESSWTARVIDFGVARRRGHQDRQAGEGTLRYAAPEQIRGQRVDARADLYAFGAIAYEALAGKPAFDSHKAKLNHAAPKLESEHPQIAELIASLLESDPRSRQHSASEVIEKWNDAFADHAIGYACENTTSKARFVRRRVTNRQYERQRLLSHARSVASGCSETLALEGNRGAGKTHLITDRAFRAACVLDLDLQLLHAPPTGGSSPSAWQAFADAFSEIDRPSLLIVDDAESATPAERSTIDLLRSKPRLGSVLVHGESKRDSEEEFDRLEIRPLTAKDAESLIASSLEPSAQVSRRLAVQIERVSCNSPSLIRSSIQQLVQDFSLEIVDGYWDLRELHYPETFESSDQEILFALDAFGRPIAEATLSAILATDEAVIRQSLHHLTDRQFVIDQAGRFSLHPQIDFSGLTTGSPSRDQQISLSVAKLLKEWSEASNAHRAAQLFRIAESMPSAAILFARDADLASEELQHEHAATSWRCAFECSEPNQRASIALKLGSALIDCGDFVGALDAFDDARDLGSDAAELFELEGRTHLYRGSRDQAKTSLEAALRTATDSSQKLRALRSLAGLTAQSGELESARTFYEDCLRVDDKARDDAARIAIHSGLGMIAKAEARLEEAIEHYRKALSIAAQKNDLEKRSQILSNLGNLYRQTDDDDRAIECLEESIDLRRSLHDKKGLAVSLNNLAMIYSKIGSLIDAESYTTRALALFEDVGDRKGILIASCNLAELAAELGAADQSMRRLALCARTAESLGTKALERECLAIQTRLEVRTKRWDAAESDARRLLALSEDPASINDRLIALTALVRVHSARDQDEFMADALSDGKVLLSDTRDSGARLDFALAEAETVAQRSDLDGARSILASALSVNTDAPRITRARATCLLGIIYRDLGPDWADRTEKHLEQAIKEFEDSGAVNEAQSARVEFAQYWSLVGEDELAASLVSIDGEFDF